MAYTGINKSTDYFNTKIYTGNGSTNTAQTGVGFQPDLTWIKERSSTSSHILTDAVRGANKSLSSNLTSVQSTETQSLISFDSDGFTVGSGGGVNENSQTYVSWNWKANGAGSANTDGDINSTASVNTTAGFSIVKYTGNGSDGATVGHGLGVVPSAIILKRLTTTTGGWRNWHSSIHATSGETKTLTLNDTDANSSDGDNISGVSATTFTTRGTSATNASGSDFIAYCFVNKTGFSKFGKYFGNGNDNGTFVYTGFKPAMIILKRSDSADGWFMYDTKRSPINVMNDYLNPNDSAAEVETTSVNIDFVSNGFKLRNDDNGHNNSSGTYIYMAFAEAPLVGTNNIPATAR